MPPYKTLSLKGIIWWQRRIVSHDRWVIKTAKTHRQELVLWHRKQLKWTNHALKRSLHLWRSRYVSTWPAHHSLWVCISRYEGGVHSINPNGHYGMLQMHAGWGYGTSYHASDDSQLVQEQAAERAYAASNYHQSFLWEQWFNYDAAESECLKYA